MCRGHLLLEQTITMVGLIKNISLLNLMEKMGNFRLNDRNLPFQHRKCFRYYPFFAPMFVYMHHAWDPKPYINMEQFQNYGLFDFELLCDRCKASIYINYSEFTITFAQLLKRVRSPKAWRWLYTIHFHVNICTS